MGFIACQIKTKLILSGGGVEHGGLAAGGFFPLRPRCSIPLLFSKSLGGLLNQCRYNFCTTPGVKSTHAII